MINALKVNYVKMVIRLTKWQIIIIPSRVSGRGYKIGPVCVSVCLSVCLSVTTLKAEPFDAVTQNLVEG